MDIEKNWEEWKKENCYNYDMSDERIKDVWLEGYNSNDGSAYLAFMRFDYGVIHESSMKLFKSKTEAEKYICELREKHGSYAISFDIVDLYCQAIWEK